MLDSSCAPFPAGVASTWAGLAEYRVSEERLRHPPGTSSPAPRGLPQPRSCTSQKRARRPVRIPLASGQSGLTAAAFTLARWPRLPAFLFASLRWAHCGHDSRHTGAATQTPRMAFPPPASTRQTTGSLRNGQGQCTRGPRPHHELPGRAGHRGHDSRHQKAAPLPPRRLAIESAEAVLRSGFVLVSPFQVAEPGGQHRVSRE